MQCSGVDHANALQSFIPFQVRMSVKKKVRFVINRLLQQRTIISVREGQSLAIDFNGAQRMLHIQTKVMSVANQWPGVIAISSNGMNLQARESIEHFFRSKITTMNKHTGPIRLEQFNRAPRSSRFAVAI